MIQNTKCECGHQNLLGTVLCESCGKPLFDDDGSAPLEMRYDGVARRSQRENPGLLDKVWNFFSSVKIAIYLIIITLLGAALGTIFTQESNFVNFDPSTYYKDTYGTIGEIYYQLGLSHTYQSWWFITLLLMLGTSLVVCSLDRVLPLYRALNKQQIRKHTNFILRQKVSYKGPLPTSGPSCESADEAAKVWVEQAAEALRKQHYRVHTDGTALLAEKNRFSRWGPYINHIGLIIFLLAVLMRSLPGWNMDQYVAFPEGQIVKIPETSYYLKNEKFTLEFYSEDEMSPGFRAKEQAVPKVYETKAVLYKCTADCDDPLKQPKLEEVHRQNIIVNEPLNYKGLLAYQYDFKQDPLLISVKPSLKNKQTGEVYGALDLSMTRPADKYQAGPYELTLKGYFPEFGLDEKGLPMTKSNEPKAPAFIFYIKGPGLAPEGQPYMYFPRQVDKEAFSQDQINGAIASKFELSVNSMDDVQFSEYTSYLNIRVDRALPFIWVGAGISMIGLVMGFYWHHRRIWLRIDDGQLSLGAHTNKNWFGIRKEVAQVLHKSGIDADPKTLEAGGVS
ncbi:Cytochrome c biogenesis protein CcsB [Paenibacillus konkukensis]|uniref:Cytochrome c biogenesis protein CcsB n=1 Tax=Paenibacillus konkukensis TaxID=2020716 RepID=A0ABY4RHQ9_9BACL|nr:cytochrome c biogenesis protein ResB [Paenibacillus konkukensis]UQZ81966.1 Cytochrome c biogenesis protein CcsB [Paenibacillus konkukensis]